jgi:hypothetical protein
MLGPMGEFDTLGPLPFPGVHSQLAHFFWPIQALCVAWGKAAQWEN